MLFVATGSVVVLATVAVFVIQPPPLPVTVVVSVNEAAEPFANEATAHLTTLVEAVDVHPGADTNASAITSCATAPPSDHDAKP